MIFWEFKLSILLGLMLILEFFGLVYLMIIVYFQPNLKSTTIFFLEDGIDSLYNTG